MTTGWSMEKAKVGIANELGNPEDIAREALDDPNAAWNASPPLRQEASHAIFLLS